jgi:hypothetical protein
MRLMRLLPQRRVPNRPRAAGSSQAGQRFQDRGPDDPDAAEQPPWLMRPAGIVAAGTAVAAAVLIGSVPALILAGTARGAARHPVDSGRGQLVSATPLRTLATTAAVRAELVADGFDPAEDRYGVRWFRELERQPRPPASRA